MTAVSSVCLFHDSKKKYTLHWGVRYKACLLYRGPIVRSSIVLVNLIYCISITLISKQCSLRAHVIIKFLGISNHSKELCFIKYEQIWKKLFLSETHTYAKELIISEGVHFIVLFFIIIIVIIIVIGLIKYLVCFMASKLSIRVDKQNDIDHLASQSPLFIVKANSNLRIREFESHHYHNLSKKAVAQSCSVKRCS